MKVALVHDYLTQRGGAERVVLSLLRAFPDAPLYTSLYLPEGTFHEFREADVRTLDLNRIPTLRRNHRLALPLLAAAFSRLRVDADVVLCSSSGWAHGARTTGRKVVYCHTPAHWLYQTERYLGNGGKAPAARGAVRMLRPYLCRWDRRAAATADRYLANSTAVMESVRDLYGIEADVVHAAADDRPQWTRRPGSRPRPWVPRLRLQTAPVQERRRGRVGVPGAARRAPRRRRQRTGGTAPARQSAPSNVTFAGAVSDQRLRWLYKASAGVVNASYEDYGLTPLEAAAFGRPAAVLRFGGFLDTVVEGRTGVYFDRPVSTAIRDAVLRLRSTDWSHAELESHARRFAEPRFVEQIRAAAAEVAA